jgi:hypothetical protein
MAQRSWWAVAAVTVAVLLTVGTAALMTSDDSGSGRAGAGVPPEHYPGSAGSAPSVARPEPSLVAPRDQVARPDAPATLAIQSYDLLAPDRLRVRYAVGVPECYASLDRAVVKEADHEVVLVLVARPPTGPANRPCPDIALVKNAVVRLHAPLGERRVIDGVSGQVVRRGHPEPDTDVY